MNPGQEQPAESGPTRRLSALGKLGIGSLVVYDFLVVSTGLRWRPLPDLVRSLGGTPRLRLAPLEPERLGQIVHRVLHLGPHSPRCLLTSLVHFRMLRRQGTPAELVIGLPAAPETPEAHAWVEVDRKVVGPPPGRLGRSAMARFGSEPSD